MTGALFLVLPLRCVNSNHVGSGRFDSLLQGLGFVHLIEKRLTPRLVFYVLGRGENIGGEEEHEEKEKDKKVRETVEGIVIKRDFNLIEQVDEYLLQILAEVLRVDESVLQQVHVREEVDYVFSTWRRPHLLVDYYRMHSSTPEIQNNFRRCVHKTKEYIRL